MRHRSIVIALACAWLAVPGVAGAADDDWRYEGVGRVVAIADVHGAGTSMRLTLQNATVVNDRDEWIAGDTHLVIVGDLLDRGPDSRSIMDFLMALEGQAAAAGGAVHVLLGNHEVMNLVGDLRYVSAAEYAAFAGEEPERERERFFEVWGGRAGADAGDAATLRARFDEQYPPGFFAHRRAFSASGRYGRWLLSKPLLVVINETAFVHGGLSPLIASIGLAGVNEGLMQELRSYVSSIDRLVRAGVLLPTDDFYSHAALLKAYLPPPESSAETLAAIGTAIEHSDSDIHSLDGPLWYRGNVSCSRLIELDRLRATLAAIGATRVVVGHTPTPLRRVLQRFDGRVVEIDTGMLADYYGGSGHALVMIGGGLAVVSETSGEMRGITEHPRQVGARPGWYLTAEQVEDLLANGEVVEVQEDALKRTVVTVSDGDHRLDTVFQRRGGRGFFPEVAAYRLDRLLELDAVPVTVRRKIGGNDGSLQLLPARSVDEPARAQAGQGGAASCPLNDQWAAMYIFDALIYNEGRTLSRMIYDNADWRLMLIGHDRSFSTETGVPRHLRQLPLPLTQAWRDALAGLTEDRLEADFGDILDRRRRRALLERRDGLLAREQPAAAALR